LYFNIIVSEKSKSWMKSERIEGYRDTKKREENKGDKNKTSFRSKANVEDFTMFSHGRIPCV